MKERKKKKSDKEMVKENEIKLMQKNHKQNKKIKMRKLKVMRRISVHLAYLHRKWTFLGSSFLHGTSKITFCMQEAFGNAYFKRHFKIRESLYFSMLLIVNFKRPLTSYIKILLY